MSLFSRHVLWPQFFHRRMARTVVLSARSYLKHRCAPLNLQALRFGLTASLINALKVELVYKKPTMLLEWFHVLRLVLQLLQHFLAEAKCCPVRSHLSFERWFAWKGKHLIFSDVVIKMRTLHFHNDTFQDPQFAVTEAFLLCCCCCCKKLRP